jgi:cation diffusion facilitator CzcD-associated flavoprotein CzcO
MKCELSNVPAASEIDIPALREKYRQEREKRLRSEGQKQYVKTAQDFADAYEHDPYTPVVPRAPISEDLDVAILGAGWSGLLSAYRLKQAGVTTFRNIDLAGDFGGCWYWNRYPGIQCDNESYCYIPLLEETGYIPSKRFADGWEIHEHFQRIANKFGLYENALFHTLIRSLRWDESIKRWRIATNRGDDIRARFVIMAGGPLNRPKLPGIPGIKNFEGTTFHTARWDYEYTGGDRKNPVLNKLADKRVAIVGTGATAIQAVPYLAKYAKQLYVIQRTPSSVDSRRNTPTDPEWVKTLQPGWQRERQINFQHFTMESFAPGEPDLIGDIWTEINRNLSAEFEAEGWPQLTFADYMAWREVMDYRVMERLRRRVDEIVKNKEAAEALKPWYRFLCKRPTSNDEFLQVFNQPNVKLIDVSATRGVERMTEKGFVHQGKEYEVDCMIFASGFEVTSELNRRWGIEVVEGRNGKSLYDHWADGYRTLHGLTTHGFPNQFFTGFIQGGLNASLTATFDQQAKNIAYIIKEGLTRGAATVEPSLEAQEAWVKHIRETAFDVTQFARECTPGYFNNEGEEKFRWYLGESYGPGFYVFEKIMDEWRAKGDMAGLVLAK